MGLFRLVFSTRPLGYRPGGLVFIRGLQLAKIDFRKEIKKQMKAKRIKTPETARKAELNVQTLYNFLAGKSEMTTANLEAVLEILGFKRLT